MSLILCPPSWGLASLARRSFLPPTERRRKRVPLCRPASGTFVSPEPWTGGRALRATERGPGAKRDPNAWRLRTPQISRAAPTPRPALTPISIKTCAQPFSCSRVRTHTTEARAFLWDGPTSPVIGARGFAEPAPCPALPTNVGLK